MLNSHNIGLGSGTTFFLKIITIPIIIGSNGIDNS